MRARVKNLIKFNTLAISVVYLLRQVDMSSQRQQILCAYCMTLRNSIRDDCLHEQRSSVSTTVMCHHVTTSHQQNISAVLPARASRRCRACRTGAADRLRSSDLTAPTCAGLSNRVTKTHCRPAAADPLHCSLGSRACDCAHRSRPDEIALQC